MALTNTSKPTTSLTNATKVSIGETWGSITTTWASETRTWLAVSQLITNISVDRGLALWAATVYPWTLPSPWTLGETMVNTSKP